MQRDFDRSTGRVGPASKRNPQDVEHAALPLRARSAVAPEPLSDATAPRAENAGELVHRPVLALTKRSEPTSSLSPVRPKIPTSIYERHAQEVLRTQSTRKTKLIATPDGLLVSRKMAVRKTYGDADLTSFGRRLKEAYEEAGYTQTSFGRAAGFSKGTMTRFLYDPKLQGLSFDNIERIEFLTGVRLQWLARGEEPKREKEPSSPMRKAAALARADGVPEDIIAHTMRRYELAPWDVHGWYQVFRNAHRRAAEDEAWRIEFRRVTMEKEIRASAEANAAKSRTLSVEDAMRKIAT